MALRFNHRRQYGTHQACPRKTRTWCGSSAPVCRVRPLVRDVDASIRLTLIESDNLRPQHLSQVWKAAVRSTENYGLIKTGDHEDWWSNLRLYLANTTVSFTVSNCVFSIQSWIDLSIREGTSLSPLVLQVADRQVLTRLAGRILLRAVSISSGDCLVDDTLTHTSNSPVSDNSSAFSLEGGEAHGLYRPSGMQSLYSLLQGVV